MSAELLLAHYERIAEAPDAIPLLRRFILDLAVRGKLVEQDPNDQPASQLLRTFHAERKVRVANKEIRNSKIPDGLEEHPFDIPESWIWLPLGATGNIFSGNSINESARERLSKTENGRPFIATKDVGYGLATLNYDNGLLVQETDATFKVARPNTPFICSEGGSAGRKIGLCDRAICFGNKLIANEPWSKISPKYVLYVYLSSFFYEEFRTRMTGIIGGISLNRFVELPFPLPPFGEQQRIVAKADELMALCNQLETKQVDREMGRSKLTLSTFAKLNEPDPETFANDARFALEHLKPLTKGTGQIKQLRQTILNFAVSGFLSKQSSEEDRIDRIVASIKRGKVTRRNASMNELPDSIPFAIPPNWLWATLGHIVTSGPQNGLSPRPSNAPDAPKAITLTATTSGQFNPAHFKTVDADLDANSDFWLKDGDLLFQRGNTREYVGIAAIYRGPERTFIYPDLIMKVRVDESLCLPFIHLAAISPYARAYMAENATGAQETMPKINQGMLVNLPIPLPPIAEQHRIVAKVDELMEICDQLEASVVEGEQTRSKLLEAMLYEALEPV